jgi:Rieske 2Fe-2S family protein
MPSATPSAPSDNPSARLRPTLASADYCSAEVFDAERGRIFHGGWMYVCHESGIPAGTKRSFDIAGESVIVARDLDGALHAFANVCRHRGAQLCDAAMAEATRGTIRCHYHSWTYGLDGALVATPRVDDDFDRDQYGLWRHRVDTWNGMVFVSLAPAAAPSPNLAAWLESWTPYAAAFERLPVASYRIGARTETVVAANWKIIVENYAECLHCAVVHPELVDLIPLYRTGNVVDPADPLAPVGFAEGSVAFTGTGRTELSVLPGLDGAPEYDGVAVFPNVFFDLTPTVLSLTAIFPLGPDRSVVVGEYLFHPDDVEREGFDPTPEVEFNELVGAQDYVVCEMVQRGVSSRAFTGGGLTAKDEYVADFVDRYRRAMGIATGD